MAWIEALPMFTPERDEFAVLLPFLRTAEGRGLAEQMIEEAKARPAPVEAIAEVTGQPQRWVGPRA